MRTFIITTVAVVSTLSGSASASHPVRPHTACPTEDSSWCVWDAQHNGNGKGRSFWVDRKGTVHYVSHRTAHRLLAR